MSTSGVLFAILAVWTSLAALGVVFSRNIVRSAVWLLFTLIGVSGLYFYLGMDFLGASQLIVYVGGTLVLVVFGVMLTAQNPKRGAVASGSQTASAILLGTVLFGLLVYVSIHAADTLPKTPLSAEAQPASVGTLGLAFAGIHEVSPREVPSGFPPDIGPLYRSPNAYLLPFEILSVHLLVVLIGAAYLARAKRPQRSEATR